MFAAAAAALSGTAFGQTAAGIVSTSQPAAGVAVATPTAGLGVSAASKAVEFRLPVRQGELSLVALAAVFGPEVGLLPAPPATATAPAGPHPSTINLSGDRGPTFVRHLSATLGPGCEGSLNAAGDALDLRVDRKALWTDDLARRRLARLVATGRADRAPDVADRGFGLTLPKTVDPARPLVVLVHGLASDNGIWGSMADQLTADGQQVAYFRYSDVDAISAAGDLLADCLADLRLASPAMPVRVVAHSMGGLVARHYLEGATFHGGVDRLVMLGTPNHGSDCSNYRWMLELYQHYCEGKGDASWSLRQVASECNGAAGRDLKPGSAFLAALNGGQRRSGVKYTVVAGNRNAFRNHTAGWVENTGEVFPNATVNWVGVRHVRWALSERAKSMRTVDSSSDGVVPLDSAKLEGVDDFVVVNADHVALACGHPPAAWDVVRARLK